MDTPTLSLLEQARAAGSMVYAEQQLFARLGRAARNGLEPSWAVWASTASLRAAWRAEQLAELLPVSVGLPTPAELIVAGQGSAAVDSLPEGGDGGRELAVACLQAYDSLLAVYAERLKHLSPAADVTLGIVLRRAVGDLESERQGLTEQLEGSW